MSPKIKITMTNPHAFGDYRHDAWKAGHSGEPMPDTSEMSFYAADETNLAWMAGTVAGELVRGPGNPYPLPTEYARAWQRGRNGEDLWMNGEIPDELRRAWELGRAVRGIFDPSRNMQTETAKAVGAAPARDAQPVAWITGWKPSGPVLEWAVGVPVPKDAKLYLAPPASVGESTNAGEVTGGDLVSGLQHLADARNEAERRSAMAQLRPAVVVELYARGYVGIRRV